MPSLATDVSMSRFCLLKRRSTLVPETAIASKVRSDHAAGVVIEEPWITVQLSSDWGR